MYTFQYDKYKYILYKDQKYTYIVQRKKKPVRKIHISAPITIQHIIVIYIHINNIFQTEENTTGTSRIFCFLHTYDYEIDLFCLSIQYICNMQYRQENVTNRRAFNFPRECFLPQKYIPSKYTLYC